MTEPVNLADFEALARERMDPASFDYYAGGSGDEVTLRGNRAAFEDIALRPRVLVDVRHIDTATTVLATPVAMPVLLAPTAFHRLAHPDGELASARAAGRCGTLMVASTISTCSLEEIAGAATGPLWFQLYVYRDRALTDDLLARVGATGAYRALVVTVDTPLLGRRERDVRNGFRLPEGVTLRNFEGAEERLRGVSTGWAPGQSFWDYVHQQLDASLTWEALDWLRSRVKLPILVKGILTPEDARLAVEHGADGIIVSNHGGRQLDGAEPTIRALPRVADAVAGRGVEVLMDGGVRRGTDVVKALALGARAVLIGRPYLYGLAASGEDGVVKVLELLRAELELAMALCGKPTVGEIDGSVVGAR